VPGDKPGEQARTILLVEEGKFGARPRVARLLEDGLEGAAVEVKGTILHREERAMLELKEDGESMRLLTSEEAKSLPTLDWPTPELVAESITLSGEVIDPKCYLGAMKPGGSKTHKACAMRCVAGGIPPMLVTRDADNRETFCLIVSPDGGAANEAVLAFVGDRVEATGRLEQHGDVLILKVSAQDIRR
jgi:hypothetical protein